MFNEAASSGVSIPWAVIWKPATQLHNGRFSVRCCRQFCQSENWDCSYGTKYYMYTMISSEILVDPALSLTYSSVTATSAGFFPYKMVARIARVSNPRT